MLDLDDTETVMNAAGTMGTLVRLSAKDFSFVSHQPHFSIVFASQKSCYENFMNWIYFSLKIFSFKLDLTIS